MVHFGLLDPVSLQLWVSEADAEMRSSMLHRRSPRTLNFFHYHIEDDPHFGIIGRVIPMCFQWYEFIILEQMIHL
jgi:hypothetical protein